MLTEQDLTSQQFLSELKILIEDVVNEDKFREAFDLSKYLSSSLDGVKNFKQTNFDLFVEYKRIIHQLRWIGLPIMVPDDVLKMFEYHFNEIFKIPEFELWEKLRIVLLGIIKLEDRDKFKKLLRETLIKNQEKITGQKLIINNQPKEPTVANWLSDYNQTLGTGQTQGLSRTEYLVNGKNIKNLGADEKSKIKLLFDLYEKLKLSSLTFEGLEDEVSLDEDGATGIIRGGVFEAFKPTEKQKQIWKMIDEFLAERRKGSGGNLNVTVSSRDDLKALLSQYPAGSLERKAVEEEMKRLNVK